MVVRACSPCLARRARSRQDDVYDLLIRNGRIIDGTGSPWYAGDVGIRDGRIAAIGRLGDAAARQTVDARAWSSRRDSSTCSGSRS